MNQVLNYRGNNISFMTEEDVLVNATDMAKAFDKQPIHFLRNSQTKEFINALQNRIAVDPVKVINGDNGGTWMHRKLALKFAGWLNPEFELWVYDRIEELMKHGFTATPDKLEELANNPDLLIQLATQLKEERAEKERLAFQNQKQVQALKESAPKVEYYNEVLQSGTNHTITTIAKELGMGAVTLNRKLHKMGVQYRHNGAWVLYSRFQGKGYTKTKTHPYYDSKGEIQTSIQTVWTEKGRQFIHDKLKQFA